MKGRTGARPAQSGGREHLEARAGAPRRSREEGGGELAWRCWTPGPRGRRGSCQPSSPSVKSWERILGVVAGCSCPSPGHACGVCGDAVPDVTYGFSCSMLTLLCPPKPQAPCCLTALGQESPGKEKGPGVGVARTSGPTTPHSLPLGDLGSMWGWGAQRLQGWGQEPETSGCVKSDKLLSQSRVACPETLHRQTWCWVKTQFQGQKGPVATEGQT